MALSTCSMQKRSKLLNRKRVLIITNKRLVIANPRTSTVKCSVAWGDESFTISAKAKTFILSTVFLLCVWMCMRDLYAVFMQLTLAVSACTFVHISDYWWYRTKMG